MIILPLGQWVQVGTIPGRKDTTVLATSEWRVAPRPVYFRILTYEDDGTVTAEHRSDGRPAKGHRFIHVAAALEYIGLEYEIDVQIQAVDPIGEQLALMED